MKIEINDDQREYIGNLLVMRQGELNKYRDLVLEPGQAEDREALEELQRIEECIFALTDQKVNDVVPDWNSVSIEWQWWARDQDGRAFFYTVKPIVHDIVWSTPGDFLQDEEGGNQPMLGDWKRTLLERPIHS